MIELKIQDAAFKRDIERFLQKNEKDFRKAITIATAEVVKEAKLAARNAIKGSKTTSGFLINNIVSEIQNGGYTGVIRSKANYSEAFEKGTKAHTISIKNKRVLAGPYRGRPVGWIVSKGSRAMGFATYGKRVHHPGTRPHPFMKPAFDKGSTKLKELISEAFK